MKNFVFLFFIMELIMKKVISICVAILALFLIIVDLYFFSEVKININNLLLYVPASIGLTALMIESYALQWLRDFFKKRLPPNIYKVFECHQCMGFWTGALCGLILVSFNFFVILACGWSISFLSPAAEKLMNYWDAMAFMSIKDENN